MDEADLLLGGALRNHRAVHHRSGQLPVELIHSDLIRLL